MRYHREGKKRRVRGPVDALGLRRRRKEEKGKRRGRVSM